MLIGKITGFKNGFAFDLQIMCGFNKNVCFSLEIIPVVSGSCAYAYDIVKVGRAVFDTVGCFYCFISGVFVPQG